jgi:hypothetical protein
MSNLKLLFIVGPGRSGSTLLDHVLGQIEGFSSGGELRGLWRRGTCACGQPIEECEFWQRVLRETFGPQHVWLGVAEWIGLQYEHVRSRPAQLLSMRSAARSGADESSPVVRYVRKLDDLYKSVASATGARVLVDSTKVPGDAYLVSLLSHTDTYFLHLVRDPRDVAWSWQRSGIGSVPERSFKWLWWNSLVEVLLARRLGPRFMRVKYEDFVASPERVLRDIRALVQEEKAALPPFTDSRTIVLKRTHMLGGNVSVFLEGPTKIKPSAAPGIPARTRAVATAFASPLMPRYGYSLLRR